VRARATADATASAPPRLTISLVTFNGSRWLDGCLAAVDALRRARPTEIELIVLDNASTDGSLEWLRHRIADDPRAHLIESTLNLGYAAAHNRIIEQARGPFVLLLNQDVQLDEGFAERALAAFEGRPTVAAVQGQIRRLGADSTRLDTLDTTGLQMGRYRRCVSRSQGLPSDAAPATGGPVFGADGPAPVYRRAALIDARVPRTRGGWEVLDEDFFMYKEDVDLAWRLKLLGWEAWYEPAALAWHARSAAGPPGTGLLAIARSNQHIPRWIKSLSWRNQRLMQVKNENLTAYLQDLPWIARRELLSLGFIVVADPRRLAAIPATLRALPGAMRKRRYLRQRLDQRAAEPGHRARIDG